MKQGVLSMEHLEELVMQQQMQIAELQELKAGLLHDIEQADGEVERVLRLLEDRTEGFETERKRFKAKLYDIIENS